jgi:two-component system, chemotaxis family, chemotaxis protein CheY
MEKINIIVVEDQREVLHAITKDLISLEDFVSIEECESALEAKQVMQQLLTEGQHIGLVISDHVMPEKTGVDFLADLQREPQFKNTRKILLTGLATHGDTINAINKAGIDRYLSKPWSGKELLDMARELLTEFVLEKGFDYQRHLPWLDKTILFEKLRTSAPEA